MTFGWLILFSLLRLALSSGEDAHSKEHADATSDEKTFTQEQADVRMDSAVATIFLGTLLGGLVLFYFISCKCEGTFKNQKSSTLKALTWTWIGLVASIFIAVNFFYLELVGIEWLHKALHANPLTADLVALGISFTIAQVWVMMVILFFALQNFAAMNKYIRRWQYWRVIILPCTIKITSHIVGFAMLHFMGFLQDFVVKMFCITPGSYHAGHHRLLSAGATAQSGCPYIGWPLWIVSFGAWMLGLVIIVVSMQIWFRVARRAIFNDDAGDHSLHRDYHPQINSGFAYQDQRFKFVAKEGGAFTKHEEEQEYETYEELWKEFSLEAMAIAASYCGMRVLLGLFTDSIPGIHQTTGERTARHLWIWFASTIVLTLSAIAWFLGNVCKKVQSYENTRALKMRGVIDEEEEEEEPWWMEFCTLFLNMTVAWSWVQFTRWCASWGFEYYGNNGTLLLELITGACALTAVAFFGLGPVGLLKDYLNYTYGKEHEYSGVVLVPAVNRGITDLIMIFSLMSAFMWELVVEFALQGIAKSRVTWQHFDTQEERDEAILAETTGEVFWMAPLIGLLLVPMYCCWAFPKSIHEDDEGHKLPIGCFPDDRGNFDLNYHFNCDPEEDEEEFSD